MEAFISLFSWLCGKSQADAAPDLSTEEAAAVQYAETVPPSEAKPAIAEHSAPAEQQVAAAMPQGAAPDDEKKPLKNERLIADLHKVLEEDKVFLRPDIHIDDVARMLLTNRTYITQLMRQEYGLSFIEYVNVARIQYSQSLLYSAQMSLDDVAYKSGFQSTSNYCRAFKRYIGTSPVAWVQQLKSH